MRRLNRRTMSDVANPPPTASQAPTHAALFLAFAKITLSGFGGTLPWTRRMFIEEKRWLTEEEFNEIYALCQFLPCLLYTSPSPRDRTRSRMPSSA